MDCGRLRLDNKRRERLKTASCLIDRAYTIIESVLDREQECVDNYPESFQDTDKYEKMEAAVEALEEAPVGACRGGDDHLVYRVWLLPIDLPRLPAPVGLGASG